MTSFVKMHGLGNDFVVFDFVRTEPPADADWACAARRLCDRRTGVGADGVVLVLPSERATVRMRIFNSDGSEARMCGNASRCVALLARDRGLADGDAVTIETHGAVVRAEFVGCGHRACSDACADQIRVDMGPPEFRPANIPVLAEGDSVIGRLEHLAAGEFEITCVSMGNPHCAVFVPDVGSIDLERLGPSIERDRLFPDRTNVEFVQVKGPRDLAVRVWERGAGATLACGTGACAALVASAARGFTERAARVSLPGGTLLVEWREDTGRVMMTGPAKYVFSGTLTSDQEWFK